MLESHYKQLSEDYAKALTDGENYDLLIYAGDDRSEFKAHSLILSIRSSYFKIALSDRWVKVEGGYKIFEKPNIEPNVLEIILR
jgi:hypothetical protein